jgi:hypothetical protein
MKEYQEYLLEKPSDEDLIEFVLSFHSGFQIANVFNQALDNSAAFLQPIVGRIATLYGWTATMFMAGTVPGERGLWFKRSVPNLQCQLPANKCFVAGKLVDWIQGKTGE